MDTLINETMVSYNEYLGNLPQGCKAIAEDIRKEEHSNALNKILQFVEGINWLISVNNLLDKNGLENKIEVETVQAFLIEVNEGLEIQDFIIVADMFEYEIKPFFENCQPYPIES